MYFYSQVHNKICIVDWSTSLLNWCLSIITYACLLNWKLRTCKAWFFRGWHFCDFMWIKKLNLTPIFTAKRYQRLRVLKGIQGFWQVQDTTQGSIKGPAKVLKVLAKVLQWSCKGPPRVLKGPAIYQGPRGSLRAPKRSQKTTRVCKGSKGMMGFKINHRNQSEIWSKIKPPYYFKSDVWYFATLYENDSRTSTAKGNLTSIQNSRFGSSGAVSQC